MRLLNRINNNFSEQTTDELNKVISSLNNLILNYKSAVLQHKYTVLPYSISGEKITNNSFQIDNLVILNFSYQGDFVENDFFTIGKCQGLFDSDLYITAVTDEPNYPTIKIDRSGNISIKGICHSNVYVSFVYIQ